MGNRAGEDVADGVEEPEGVIDPERAAHGAEAEESGAAERGADQDELARTKARDQDGADPKGEQGGQGEAKGDLLAGPVESALVVIVEEGHVVVGQAYRNAEGEEGRRCDPPAVERLHR